MASLLARVVRVLAQNLDEFESRLERVPETGRITGFVVSSSFDKLSDERQQDLLWNKILRRALTQRELEKIGPVVTMTPFEAEVHANDR